MYAVRVKLDIELRVTREEIVLYQRRLNPYVDVPGGGVLPYITYMGMCRPTGSWF